MAQKYTVLTTEHPEVPKGPRHMTHGPYDTKVEAERYAARLRASGDWGAVTVRLTRPSDFPRTQLDDLLRF